jgi:peptide/nickel transport system permease protein
MLRRFVLQRILAGLLSLFVFVTAVFFLSRWMIPGDLSSNFAQSTSGDQEENLQRMLGLDRPLLAQYLSWLGNVVTLDLGGSGMSGMVAGDVMDALPWTLAMFGLGIGLSFWAGSALGRLTGWRRSRTNAATVGAATLTSFFPPLLIFFIFYGGLNLLGYRAFNNLSTLRLETWEAGPRPAEILWRMLATIGILSGIGLLAYRIARPHRWYRKASWLIRVAVPIVAVYRWNASGYLDRVVDLLGFLAMPVLALFILMVGDITLVVAASMDGLADSDFSMTARAKGLTKRQVRNRHAGRVALMPALSRLTANLPFALGGLVIIEASFARLGGYRVPIPGLASVMFGSLRQRNLILTLGGLLVVGVITLVIRIGLDVAGAVLDPRVKLASHA